LVEGLQQVLHFSAHFPGISHQQRERPGRFGQDGKKAVKGTARDEEADDAVSTLETDYNDEDPSQLTDTVAISSAQRQS